MVKWVLAKPVLRCKGVLKCSNIISIRSSACVGSYQMVSVVQPRRIYQVLRALKWSLALDSERSCFKAIKYIRVVREYLCTEGLY